MASIDIGKLVQESIMTTKDISEEGIKTSDAEINFEGINSKLNDIIESKEDVKVRRFRKLAKNFGVNQNVPMVGHPSGGDYGNRSSSERPSQLPNQNISREEQKEKSAVRTAKTAKDAKTAKGAKTRRLGIAGGAAVGASAVGAGKVLMNRAESQRQAHSEQLRDAAKAKLAAALEKTKAARDAAKSGFKDKVVDKAQSMGSHLKALGSQAMEKVKENPKTALATAGVVGAGLAAKKLMSMRKKKAA